MTPAARVQTAIEILDRIRAGEAAEKALTSWARRARFAGAKDRAAIRDHVFDALRQWRSAAALGGGENGRARMLGLLRLQGADVEALFAGQGHGPAALGDAERATGRLPEGAEAWDLPDWLADRFAADLGSGAEATALALRTRAPVFVRANLLKTTRDAARTALEEDGVIARPHPLSETALEVIKGARGLTRTRAFDQGLVEMQDAASQAVSDLVPLSGAQRVLDYCAGGGGKTLALAARAPSAKFEAHDVDFARMADLPERARRAGAQVERVEAPTGLYDVVMADAPCSGSGAWRRAPEGKWRLTPDRLDALTAIQREILDTCAALVAPGGWLAYATCSVLRAENEAQIERFLAAHRTWKQGPSRRFLPEDGGDGFYLACLQRGAA
ncbi:RsmB/NOP family class I SAM-dependent RNA methyltransferase [Sagittula salina]|uniref:RsmB/NOP family class I SAM-dependent RNA methyltransferase n=1 Tax=Sagittula salina TaxID=2820268 RepID=A0A940MQJ7_9RHOB|nr:RsmB/NOP family class I SAM-dependent RNA methyltransferase [Sagittula salina]